MDFKLVIEKLLAAFKDNDISYALIGGFALGIWKVPRATVDVDFLVSREDLGKVDKIMKNMGYECRYQTENVSQYVSPLDIFGEIDFIHAFREISLSMLSRAEERKIFNETLTIKVLRVEDLIGLKVQAMANDESRKAIDFADIEALMKLHGKEINWSDIEGYFNMFGFYDMFCKLKGKYSGNK